MTRARSAAIGVVLVAAVAAGAGVASRRGTHAPFFPRFRRQVRDKLYSAVAFATRFDPRGAGLMRAPPTMPKPEITPSALAYKSAIAAGKERPGALAFRADTELYCEYNRAALEEQARKEGLSVEQVKELTFFGFAAMRTTQPEKVEEAVGRALSDVERRKLGEILQEENRAFASVMRQQVDEGASEEQRWETIRTFEQHYMEQLEATFGVTAAQFDQMLAPDADERGAGPTVPLPPGVPLPPPEPPRAPPEPPDPNVPAKPSVPPLAPAPKAAAPASAAPAPATPPAPPAPPAPPGKP